MRPLRAKMIRSISPQAEGEANFTRPTWLLLLALLIGSIIAIAIGKSFLLTIAVVLGMIILFVTLANPDLGLFIFLVAIYTNFSSVLIVSYGFPSTAKPFVALMGVVIFVRYFIFKDEYRGWAFLAILLGVLAFLGTLSLFYASSYGLASDTLIEYFKDAMIGIIVVMMAQRQGSLKIAVWAILSAGLLMATLSVFQQITGTFSNHYWGFARIIPDQYGNRLSGPIGDPNYFGQIMVVLLPIALDRFWNEKSILLKALGAITFFMTLATVVFTYSRGAFLAMIVAFFVMAIIRPSRIRFAMIGLIVLIFTFQFLPASYRARMSSLLNILPSSSTGGYVDASVQGRTSENLVAWNMFTDHPVLGVGIGNYNFYYQAYSRKLGLDARTQDRSAHNLYLEVAAERGVLGLLVFSSLIILTLRQAFVASKKFMESSRSDLSDLAIALGISFIAYLIAAIFLHDAYPRYFYLIVGLCWALPQCAQYLIIQSRARVTPQ